MHCCRRRLLRRGLKFHVCTINKSAHKKKSGNLFNDPCTSSNTCFLKLLHFSEIITKEICRAIYKEVLDIQLAHSRLSLCQYLIKKNNNNNVTTCTVANYPLRDPNICQKTYTIYCLICLKVSTSMNEIV